MGAAETRLRHFPANSLPIRSNSRRLAPLSSNIGWAKPLRSHNQNPGHPIRDTLRSSSPGTARDGTPAFAGSPAAHDTIQCPAVLCAILAWQPHARSKNVCLSAATPAPRGRHGYWLRPLGRRIRQVILEYEKTPEKFQNSSLAEVYFGTSPNSSRSSGFDRKP